MNIKHLSRSNKFRQIFYGIVVFLLFWTAIYIYLFFLVSQNHHSCKIKKERKQNRINKTNGGIFTMHVINRRQLILTMCVKSNTLTQFKPHPPQNSKALDLNNDMRWMKKLFTSICNIKYFHTTRKQKRKIQLTFTESSRLHTAKRKI